MDCKICSCTMPKFTVGNWERSIDAAGLGRESLRGAFVCEELRGAGACACVHACTHTHASLFPEGLCWTAGILASRKESTTRYPDYAILKKLFPTLPCAPFWVVENSLHFEVSHFRSARVMAGSWQMQGLKKRPATAFGFGFLTPLLLSGQYCICL